MALRVQAPEELRSLKRELLGGKRGNLDRPVGRLRIAVMQGRDLKDVRLKSPAHSFKSLLPIPSKHCTIDDSGVVFCGQVEVGGKMLPYAAVTHSKAEPGWRRLETEVAKGENNEGDGKNPRWEATLGPMDVYDEFDTITVTVYDKEVGEDDDFIGSCTIPLGKVLQLAPPVDSAPTSWWKLTAFGHDDANGVPKPSHGEVQVKLDFTARELSEEERITAEVNARRKDCHLAKGARDPEDVCVIQKREQGFGAKARKHSAYIQSHRFTRMMAKTLNAHEHVEKIVRQQQEETDHDNTMMAAAKKAASALASCEKAEQQARVAEVDPSQPSFRLATATFAPYVQKMLETDDKRLVRAGARPLPRVLAGS